MFPNSQVRTIGGPACCKRTITMIVLAYLVSSHWRSQISCPVIPWTQEQDPVLRILGQVEENASSGMLEDLLGKFHSPTPGMVSVKSDLPGQSNFCLLLGKYLPLPEMPHGGELEEKEQKLKPEEWRLSSNKPNGI
nr:uncharacterized protein LOC106838971 isoform X6 [Equus asinus]